MKWWQYVLNVFAFIFCCFIAAVIWVIVKMLDAIAPPLPSHVKPAEQWAREIYRRSEDRAFGELGIKWLTEWIKKIQEDAQR